MGTEGNQCKQTWGGWCRYNELLQCLHSTANSAMLQSALQLLAGCWKGSYATGCKRWPINGCCSRAGLCQRSGLRLLLSLLVGVLCQALLRSRCRSGSGGRLFRPPKVRTGASAIGPVMSSSSLSAALQGICKSKSNRAATQQCIGDLQRGLRVRGAAGTTQSAAQIKLAASRCSSCWCCSASLCSILYTPVL